MPTVGRMQDEQQQHTIQEQQVCEGWGGGCSRNHMYPDVAMKTL